MEIEPGELVRSILDGLYGCVVTKSNIFDQDGHRITFDVVWFEDEDDLRTDRAIDSSQIQLATNDERMVFHIMCS
jgi:hypothetical protein